MDYTQSSHLVRFFDFGVLHMELNTPLYIFVLVLVVMFFLNKWLFRPVLRTLDNRERTMESLAEAAMNARGEFARLAEDYEDSLAQVRTEVAQVRAEQNRLAQQEVAAILEDSRTQARAEFDAAMGELEGEVAQAKAGLAASSRHLAEQVTNRVVSA